MTNEYGGGYGEGEPNHVTLQSPFALDDQVRVDGGVVTGIITGIWWKDGGTMFEVSWWAAYVPHTEWFPQKRLTLAK